MRLGSIISELDIETVSGHTDIDITGIAYDSRMVKEGNLFVAIEGYNADGHNYVHEAISNGAKAIVVQRDSFVNLDIAKIIVKDSRKALAKISSEFYNNPSKKLNLIGITGTNGKTSTSYIIESIFHASGRKLGVVGTIGCQVNGKYIKTKNTTPESLELQQLFYEIVKSNVEYCVMEVSSHALELNRVYNSDFDVGIFTNITKEHLDYHKTIKNYYNAKKKLFLMTKKCNIINIDDEYGKILVDELSGVSSSLLTYGINTHADIFATNLCFKSTGVSFKLHMPNNTTYINMKIPGLFTVYNSLAAATCAYVYGIDISQIKVGLEKVEGIKGRFELVPTNKDFTVIIDFAHTADALEKVLSAINQFAEGRKIIVFGAGGDRDRTKRAPMGEVAGRYCDLCIVTSDNPRTEEPQKIIDDIIEGVKKVNGNYISIVDRKEAIEYAIKNSMPNDIILLAGKGHETYTIIGNKVLAFDEREIVKKALMEL